MAEIDESRVVRVVFKALLIDLLAFTAILPLFPRLLNYYQLEEAGNQYKNCIYSSRRLSGDDYDKWDTVLLGGLVGSLFSLLQFIISPMIGRASDRLGRRSVLLWTMLGNIMSTIIWLFARSFTTFILARIIAGFSEGNVQLSIAIISDVTTPERRSRNLALVGIAFAVAFTLGPPLGAWFASMDLTQLYPRTDPWGIYPYSMPALVSLVLLLVETVYLYTSLPETRHYRRQAGSSVQPPDGEGTKLANLKRLNWIHCLYSFLFSGMEFTLVFLTFDVLDYSHMQQGKLLAFMGILSALIQGGYVRSRVHSIGEKKLVVQGMASCAAGLACLSAVASSSYPYVWLFGGVSLLAFASGTVANCLNSLASLQCEDDETKGKVLGEFRSFGQLGRALGPISTCGLYWLTGPAQCYGVGATMMIVIMITATTHAPSRKHDKSE
ncbi:hypothetical protein DFQ28_004130 [Apophysomyces sp. BC1034]|nr:hypothetical protein DFQ29_003228 [Apophysomyces sp. BC1021]KAG0188950.1 hypothetical protein DFQ28_004130 [Apophysomyces sp. BC1034]